MRKIIIFAVLLFLASSAWAVPEYLNYSGVLKDASGAAQTGDFTMRFKLYSASSGGTLVFDSGDQTVTASSGIYAIQLGPLNDSHFSGADRWIEVSVGGETLSPRLKINSVAYAIHAAAADSATTATTATNANTLGGLSATTDSTANTIVVRDSSGYISSGRVNISTSAGDPGVIVKGDNTSDGYGVWGASNTGTGVWAQSTSGSALHIKGKLTATTGSGYCAGTGLITSPDTFATVANTAVTNSSIIMLTVGRAGAVAGSNSNGGIRISARTAGTGFTVSTMNGAAASNDIPFSYLIIN